MLVSTHTRGMEPGFSRFICLLETSEPTQALLDAAEGPGRREQTYGG